MKSSNPLSFLAPSKWALAEGIFNSLFSLNGIISVTFVGSFCDRQDVLGISDIDVIVICENLTKTIFQSCIGAVEGLKGSVLGFPGKNVYINSSFGPLKFDTRDQIVIHLMIYDREGHRRHVMNSPFTCYDWERSPVFMGFSLAEIYPVLKLQPGDFFTARRGLEDYLHDLEEGVLSYREYDFDQHDHAIEIRKTTKLSSRQSGEYAYHIIRNLILNYAKLLSQKNELLADEDFYSFWESNFPDTAYIIPHYQHWKKIKMERGVEFPDDVIRLTKDFLNQFDLTLQEKWVHKARKMIWARHAESVKNDGTFLGQGRDPEIRNFEIRPLQTKFMAVYSSPLRRCIQTAERLAAETKITNIDHRLLEQNYGKAEGLSFHQLQQEYPEVPSGWKDGKDMRFPGGENIAEVDARLSSFIKDLSLDHEFPTLIVTHNVVLRCLLGRMLGLNQRDWYKLLIPHLEPYEFLGDDVNPDAWYLNLSREQKAFLVDHWIEMERSRNENLEGSQNA